MAKRAHKKGGPTRSWPAEHIALLGTMPDVDLATLIGKSRTKINQKRWQLGIPSVTHRGAPFGNSNGLHNEWNRAWTLDEIALLGTDTDASIAIATGRTLRAVQRKRIALSIPSVLTPGRRRKITSIEL